MVHSFVQLGPGEGDEGLLVGLFQQLFEDIVDDGAVVVRTESSPFPGLSIQTVAAEVLEGAVVVVVDPGGGQGYVLPEKVGGDGRVVDREHTGHQSPVQRGELFPVGAVVIEGREGFPDTADRDRVLRPDVFGVGFIGGSFRLRIVVGVQFAGVEVVVKRGLCVLFHFREEALDRGDEFRGQMTAAGGVEAVPGEVQPFPGRRDRGVSDEALFAGPEVFREGEFQPLVPEKCTLVEREEPGLADDRGEHALFETCHEHGVRGGEADPVGGGHRDLIEALRDAAEVGHGEDGVEQVGILLHVPDRLVIVDGRQPVDDRDDDVPDAVLLAGEVGKTGFIQRDGVFFQMLRDFRADEEVIERLADFPEALFLTVAAQSDQRADDPGAGVVQERQCLVRLRFAAEVRVETEGVPGERVLPAAALDVPGKDVVLQLRDLFGTHAGEPRLQVLKQVLGGEALGEEGEDRTAEHDQRLVFHRLAGVVEKRDVISPERAQQFFFVVFFVADDDRDISGPQPVFPQEFTDGGGDPLTLLKEALALTDGDVVGRFIVDAVGGVEEVLFEEREFRGDVPRAVSDARFFFLHFEDADVPFLRHVFQPLLRLFDGVEDHGGILAVGAQRDIDVLRLGEDAPQKGQLLPGEALEAVDGERVAAQELCVVEDPAEFFDLQVFVRVALPEHGIVYIVDEEEFLQLPGEDRTVHGFRRLFELEEARAGLAHFPEDGDELLRQTHVIAVFRVVSEFVRHGGHRPQHEDETGAVVGDDAGIAARGAEDEVGETGEAQHLDVLGRRIAERLQHGPFGVIGVLLRHDEDELVLALLCQSPEDPADIFGFPGTGTSGNKLKHNDSPFIAREPIGSVFSSVFACHAIPRERLERGALFPPAQKRSEKTPLASCLYKVGPRAIYFLHFSTIINGGIFHLLDTSPFIIKGVLV